MRALPLVWLFSLTAANLACHGGAGLGPPPEEAGASLPNALPLVDWPRITPGVESRSFSSFDRTGRDDDGFKGTYSTLYLTPSGEHVIVDAEGPGRLNALWFTSGIDGHAPLGLGQVRFYFDGETKPRSSVDADTLFGGGSSDFPAAFVFNNRESTGGFVSFVPLPFASSLVITTENKPFFFSAQVDTFPSDLPVTSWTPGAIDPAFAALFQPLALPEPLLSAPLDTTGTGAGTIDALSFAPDAPPDAATLHAARIRITFDDSPAVSVDCPLDMFFGSGLGATTVSALPFQMTGAAYTNRMPMPFWKSYHVVVSGLYGSLSLAVGPARYDARTSGVLHAVYRHAPNPAHGQDVEYLSFSGAGKLVGTVLAVTPDQPSIKKWWEGDLRSYADGRRSQSIHGTGHEDDHLAGWSNQLLEGPFSLPFNGEPESKIIDQTGQINASASLYRTFNGIPFLSQINHSVEHGSEDTVTAIDYEATTFFYAQSAPWEAQSDLLSVCRDEDRSVHAYDADGEGDSRTVTSAFEGRFIDTNVEACHRSATGTVSFTLTVDPGNHGVVLRRMFDQSVGGQSATVSVDGARVGRWRTAEYNKTAIFAERDFFLPASSTQAKSVLQVSLVVDPGSPPWDAVEYRAFPVVPPPG
jgi:hypothetical protein